VSADSIEIRACRPEDVEAVLALWARAGAIPRPTDHASALARRLERDRALFALAWHGERLVGTLMGGWDGWRGNMYRLVVDRDYRRMGIAGRLIAAVEAELRALGAERVTSLVFKDEPGAPELWRSVGYRPDPAIERYAKDLTTP
jgi:ribosomal protein S18 acetylase RimI-like enzyme